MTRGYHAKSHRGASDRPEQQGALAGVLTKGKSVVPAAAGNVDSVRVSRKLKVLLLVAACFFFLWLAITIFSQGNLWPLLAIPIMAGAWFFYEIGAVVAVGLAGLLLVQSSYEKPGTIMLAITTFAILGLVLGWAQRRQRAAHRQMLRSSLTDSLTGLFNYGHFMRCLESEISRADRYGGYVTLIMFDIDHFKLFNDRYGHEKGNEALRAVAAALRREKRDSDVVARYGGEEFVLMIPEDEEAGVETAGRFREAIASAQVPLGGGSTTGVTVSAGVACYPASAGSKEELLDKVDQLLYSSKRRGRNQVSVASGRKRLAVM